MGNIFSSLPVECILTRSWDICCGDERAKYVRDLRKNVKSLEKLLPDLLARKADILSRVTEAEEHQGRRRLEVVALWLTEVTTAEIEAGKLIQESPQEMKNLCFGGCCSKNFISSYKFGKKVVQELNTVHDLLARTEKEDFKLLFGPQQQNQVEERPLDPTVGLDSTFDHTWSFIQNEEVGIIGVHGPGGVGKTTLLQQINNKFSDTDFFVIWAVVSKGCDPEKLQEDIAKRINLFNESWKMKRYDEKAIDIFRTLSRKKFALLLDDIWEHVDLTEMGIPIKSNGSKIILTTRNSEVCDQMQANEKVMVECLAPAEAFKLFSDKVGEVTLASHPKIPELAEAVAKECAGLPLAIITVARAMRGKRTPEEWNLAIEDLQRYATEFPTMADKVLSRLKFSYDYLPNETVRSCFLYCCLFREDSNISKSELIEFWSVEGFLGQGSAIRNHNRGVGIIETLLKACLLEEHDTTSVKMHDVTREMALWIAQELEKEKYGFFVRAGFNLSGVPGVKEWGKAKKVSLMHNNIKKLQKVPSCSHLVTLFLNNNNLKKINGQFFQCMPLLTVLDLSHNEELHKLPSEISTLVSLEYLNLSRTGIRTLPIGLGELIRLKYFNLEFTDELEQIPCKLISNFKKLQQFKMVQHPLITRWNISEGSAKLFFEELRSLKHLGTLTITISSDAEFNEFQKSKKLQSCTSKLTLYEIVVSVVSILTNMELEHLESLDMYRCEIVEELDRERVKEDDEEMKLQTSTNITHSMIFGKRFDRLHTVTIVGCTGVVDLTWLIVAPNLTSITVRYCEEIEEIINVEKLSEKENLNLFAKLEDMWLSGLPKLQSIYKYALPFSHLKKLTVYKCEKLRKLPINSNTSKDIKFAVPQWNREWWEEELEWEDEATRMAFSNRVEYLN